MPLSLAVLLLAGQGLLFAQSTGIRDTFDVASVKRVEGNQGAGRGVTVQPGGRFMAPNATVRQLVAAAYGVFDNQITGGPGWIGSDRFEVLATTNPDVSLTDARAMLGTLLRERFGLSAHVEQRELPVYLLQHAREDRQLGTQLRPSGPDCAFPTGPRDFPLPPPPPPPPPVKGRVLSLDSPPLPCPSLVFGNSASGHWSIRSWSIAQLAQRLTNTLGRPVIDRTGLDGSFDFDLTFAEQSPTIDAAAQAQVPALTTAIREQLGLRLESARAPVDVLVIDRIERPTEN
jgi:uncharacterized protein (TIGR03435 family)